MQWGLRSASFLKTPHRALRNVRHEAAAHGLVGNLALAPLADGPLALRRLLACHRNHRADLLGRERRWCTRARRIGQPLGDALSIGHPAPPLAPIPYRLRPNSEFPRTFAHTYTLVRMQDDAGAQR